MKKYYFDFNGVLRVVIEVTSGPVDLGQPVNIHFNNCTDICGVRYPLNNVINGSSETLIETTLAGLIEERPLSLNVHKSIVEASFYIACGNL